MTVKTSVLVDTSVWIQHLKVTNNTLVSFLEEGIVCCHPWVAGELAAGNIKNRKKFLVNLLLLPTLQVMPFEEIFVFINDHKLFGIGLSFVDIQLLLSTIKTPKMKIFTLDKKLVEISKKFGVAV
ncbi:MAG: type II toxin-antitoxin system VapC family toxin [Oligoflexia bacterium]|nr:type II toxin-antitoxin system VapC family toxin [Oligoflexia bacterium]MBF0366748.1 type II toxin-antitoxin system VapC family toxin [Oligoflexia bacterium]